ncbi:histidinolphosphatase [Podila minutissima]|uniref:Histidinol-phosphatase n=1 Tax=Podila minutissima TaxID=64525 RepID=A0A9P5SWY7_9FUNG|nr:histidinolphosphatase [Podila minutissima]
MSSSESLDNTKLFSYHSHSGQFCNHAKGTLEQVVQAAIDRRFTSLGLSEHMPRYKPDQLYPEEAHLTIDDLQLLFDNYVTEAARLQEKYKDQIEIVIGFETEYFGHESITYIQNLRQPHRKRFTPTGAASGHDDTPFPTIQYIVGSLHHLRGIPIDFSKELYLKAFEDVGKGSWQTLFEVYFDEQFQLIRGVQPEVIGHFDLIRLFFDAIQQQVGDSQVRGELSGKLWELVQRNIDVVAIKAAGGRFTLSDDSHGPDDIGMFYDPKLKDYLERMGIDEVYYLVARDSPQPPSGSESFKHVQAKSVLAKNLRFR